MEATQMQDIPKYDSKNKNANRDMERHREINTNLWHTNKKDTWA